MDENEKRGRGRPRKERPAGLVGELGESIEKARKGAGLTAVELGEKAGVGTGTVIRAEGGHGASSIDTILAIANALQMSGEELLSTCADWTAKPKKQRR